LLENTAYWAVVRSDTAIEAGGGEAGLQTDWTCGLNRPSLHAAINSFTLPQDREMKLCCLVNRPFMTRTPVPRRAATPASLPSLTPPVKQICHGNIHSAEEAESVGEGERVAYSKQQCLKRCPLSLSHRHS